MKQKESEERSSARKSLGVERSGGRNRNTRGREEIV